MPLKLPMLSPQGVCDEDRPPSETEPSPLFTDNEMSVKGMNEVWICFVMLYLWNWQIPAAWLDYQLPIFPSDAYEFKKLCSKLLCLLSDFVIQCHAVISNS